MPEQREMQESPLVGGDTARAELEIDVSQHPVLARLIDEVKNEQANRLSAYNRMHNRHNRSR